MEEKEKIYNTVKETFNLSFWKNLSLKIFSIENSFCYRDFVKSAELCLEELKKAGARNVHLIELKADGETSYDDFIMPMAWDVDFAKLYIIEPQEFSGKVIADIKNHPFHVANRCGNTPSEGTIGQVIHIKDIDKFKNLNNTFVFCEDINPMECREKVENTEAMGIISSYTGAPERRKDIYWINGWVKKSGWYHTKKDRQMLCFSISPEEGKNLRKLLEKTTVRVKAIVKSKTYPGKIYSITGLIPGKTKKEIIFLAHLYEPMITDNATGVAGVIEICRILNNLIEKKLFSPDIGIRFLFSMERYGMVQFFKKNKNIVYALNVDSLTPDIVKTGKMKLTLYGSPFTNPFFGDWIFEKLLDDLFPDNLPWKKERAVFKDDTFVSDNSLNIPSIYFTSNPAKLHHNSADSKVVNWDIGKEILCTLATYVYILSSSKFLQKYTAPVYSCAKKELYTYLEKLSWILVEKHLSREDLEERIFFITDYIEKKINSMRKLGIIPEEKHKKEIKEIARREGEKLIKENNLKPQKERKLTREDKKAENIIIKWRKPVFIFSLADIPHKERVSPPEEFYSLINRADGSKNLYEIFQEISFEREIFDYPPLSEEEKKNLTKYVKYLGKYNYLKIKYRIILTKKDIKNSLEKLGIKKGDKIIVHSSLSSMGYVRGGAKAVCEAFMEAVGKNGLVMMPSFNHRKIFIDNPSAYFSPLETPTTNGIIPDTFWRMKGVFRSLNPTHAFAVWGKDAKNFVKEHHKGLTMGKGSPLYLLEKAGGKIILIDTPTANTFHHVVEMTNNVPCLGKRTEEYPVKLPSGEIVKVRTWSFRESPCIITDKIAYLSYMRKKKMIKEGKIGNADVLVIDMKTCRKVIEKFLRGEIEGYSGCKKCSIKPWTTPQSVESDWDEINERVKPDTSAFVGDYDPPSF